jgi:hypothetical protein
MLTGFISYAKTSLDTLAGIGEKKAAPEEGAASMEESRRPAKSQPAVAGNVGPATRKLRACLITGPRRNLWAL